MTVTPYTNFTFWALLAVFVLVHSALPVLRKTSWLRNWWMIFASYAIILCAQEKSAAGALLFGLFVLTLLAYGLGTYLLNIKEGRSRVVLAVIGVGFIVLVLCCFKYGYVQEMLKRIYREVFHSGLNAHIPKHLYFIGVSYFSFKLIHFVVDCYNRKIQNLDFLTFVNYVCFFPGFFAGPINRYAAFAKDIKEPREVALTQDFLEGGKRLINGLFKKAVSGVIQPFAITTLNLNQAHHSSELILSVYAYMFYIYFDFSGYSDMAIGSARLVGLNLPENFNNPFLKRNLQQFWANWHMSLTTWLTDYIYWPLARKLRHIGLLTNKPITTSNICIILAFMVCGLWHGEGLNFFLWGVYHGLGLAGVNVCNQLINRHTSLRFRKFVNTSTIAKYLSVFITFQYVAVGFLLFACDMNRIQLFFRSLFF